MPLGVIFYLIAFDRTAVAMVMLGSEFVASHRHTSASKIPQN